MKNIYLFLKSEKVVMIGAFLIIATFFSILSLYHIDTVYLIYPTILSLFYLLIYLIYKYILLISKLKMLHEILNLKQKYPIDLPQAGDEMEELYQRIIKQEEQNIINEEIKAKKQFTDLLDYFSIWIHQIKTPISAMGLLLQNEDNSVSRALRINLNRIEQYVEMALAYVRLESSTKDLVFKEVDLNEILVNSIKKFSPEFINKKIKLEYSVEPSTIISDEKWLNFLIEQILSNALKYTEAGSITITLNNQSKLQISDTGIGIAKEDLPRIFEKGFTGFNGRINKKASGIGLYLSKKVSSMLGYSITIDSEINKGTTVILDLKQYQFLTKL